MVMRVAYASLLPRLCVGMRCPSVAFVVIKISLFVCSNMHNIILLYILITVVYCK